MSTRPRMNALADILVPSPDRAEAPHQPPPHPREEKPKTSNPKTRKKVFGKLASRRITPGKNDPVEIHRLYGERGDFEKVTVTLPSDVRGLLLEESLRRKKQRVSDWAIAAIVREAIAAYLSPRQ